jgi:hypothetical protein
MQNERAQDIWFLLLQSAGEANLRLVIGIQQFMQYSNTLTYCISKIGPQAHFRMYKRQSHLLTLPFRF